MKSDVYFVKTDDAKSAARLSALKKILDSAKPFSLFKPDEIIPVKLTIGDSPCVYNVRPELVKAVVSEIKKQKARPFLFDTSVIYTGSRQNAVDHLNLAEKKGFGQGGVGAPFIIADGVFGQDGKEYAVNSEAMPKIKVPSFVGMCDNLVVLTHATGHIVSQYAGAIKNIAMGMACRPTKLAQHQSVKPSVIKSKCTGCKLCIGICPAKAITFRDGKSQIDPAVCIGCGECLCACKFDAIMVNWQIDPGLFCRRMVDVAHHVLSKFKQAFFITFAFDITKECDCISNKDESMVAENIGILASRDVLAIDRAAMDLISKNKKGGYFDRGRDYYSPMFEYAAKKGLGNLDYDLVKL
ncbi:MAG: DUF362 domain-containing protein [Spirochaetales bacterium]|nr:MAG: DUF362 domain-containing protein [Spirochaetales bacterium]